MQLKPDLQVKVAIGSRDPKQRYQRYAGLIDSLIIAETIGGLEKDDISAALMYAAEAVREHQIPLIKAG